jgi:hypothetical protein
VTAIWPCLKPANTNIIEAFERVVTNTANTTSTLFGHVVFFLMITIWPCLNPTNTNVIEAFERVVAMFETCQYQHY